jgi:hypothetical protein
MAEIDLEDLCTPEHGYAVNDEDDDDPVLLDREGNQVQTWRDNAMRYVLARSDYDDKDHEVVGEPDPLIVGRALTD